MQDPTLERTLRGHRGSINCLSWGSGNQLASGSADNTVMAWCFGRKLKAFRFVGHKQPVTCVAFSPDGLLLASGSKDCTVCLWPPSVCVHASSWRCRPASKVP